MYLDIYLLKFLWNLFKIFRLLLNFEFLGILNFLKFIKMFRGGMFKLFFFYRLSLKIFKFGWLVGIE